MLVQAIVGQQNNPDSASPIVLRAGHQGDLIVSELHAPHYEQCYRKNMWTGATQAAGTTTVGLATTYTGLVLSNPNASNINLVVNKVGASFIVAFPAAAAIGLMTGFNSAANVTHTTPGTPYSTFIGSGSAAVGKIDISATLSATPVVHSIWGSGVTGAITTSPAGDSYEIDIEGGLIVPPGGFVAIYTSAVSGTSGFFGYFEWEETPV